MTTKPACLAMGFSGNLWGSFATKCGFGQHSHADVRRYYSHILGESAEARSLAAAKDTNAQIEAKCREWYLNQIKSVGDTPVMVMLCDWQSEEWGAFKRHIPINIIYQSAKTWNGNYPEEKEPYITVYIFQFIQEKL